MMFLHNNISSTILIGSVKEIHPLYFRFTVESSYRQLYFGAKGALWKKKHL